MNDLTTTPNSKPAMPTSPVLSKALSELLDDASSPDDAARAIAADPGLLLEVKAAYGGLKAVAEAKAGPHGVKEVIARRFQIYPQPMRNEAEWAAWWADYMDPLADCTLSSLEAGMRAYVADPSSEFMPKPGKLRELAFTAPCRSLTRYYRARRAIQLASEVPAIRGPRADPLAVKTMLAEFQSKSIPSKPTAGPRSNPGAVDEGGITAQMRALIARRQAEEATR